MNKADSLARRALRVALLAGAVATTTLAALGTAGCDRKVADAAKAALEFNAVDITGADYARQLNMQDFDGKPRTLADFKGKVAFVFFGYTQCPDICPTTMAELAEVKRRLGADGERVQGVFITLDPERDTNEVLKQYLQSMDPSFLGLRGDAKLTEDMSREFKIFYQKVPTKGGSYTLDHTAGAYVFDPDGAPRLYVRYGMPVDQLTADIKRLLHPEAEAALPTSAQVLSLGGLRVPLSVLPG
jgi:protein SCO1